MRGSRLTTTSGLAIAALIISLTVGKAWLSVPGLWEAQHVREVRLFPFATFRGANVWWGPWLNLVGNIGLFVPLGYVAYRGSVVKAAAWGLACSLAIEVSQYVWALGFSDTDDLIFNTAGAWLGAWAASRIGVRPELLCALTVACVAVVVPYVALGLWL